MKELIVDFRRQQREHIDRAAVEKVKSFKFLGVHNNDNLKGSIHTDSVVNKAQQRLFNPRKFGLAPKTLNNFYRRTIESILLGCINARYANYTVRNHRALYRVVQSGQRITGDTLPAFQDIYSTWCHRKTIKYINRLLNT